MINNFTNIPLEDIQLFLLDNDIWTNSNVYEKALELMQSCNNTCINTISDWKIASNISYGDTVKSSYKWTSHDNDLISLSKLL